MFYDAFGVYLLVKIFQMMPIIAFEQRRTILARTLIIITKRRIIPTELMLYETAPYATGLTRAKIALKRIITRAIVGKVKSASPGPWLSSSSE
jgi:hypothetical protein